MSTSIEWTNETEMADADPELWVGPDDDTPGGFTFTTRPRRIWGTVT